MKEEFNEYMVFFKSQSLEEKQNIIYKQLQILAEFTNNLCKELSLDNELIMNKELLDLEKEGYTQDDFTEGVITLVNSIQNSICDYSNGISNILDNMNE